MVCNEIAEFSVLVGVRIMRLHSQNESAFEGVFLEMNLVELLAEDGIVVVDVENVDVDY